MQLKVFKIETKTKVPSRYRYPFYIEMLWFLIERYVHCYTGYTYLNRNLTSSEIETISDFNDLDKLENANDQTPYKTFEPVYFTLTQYEINGLFAIVDFLENLNEQKKCVPKQISKPEMLYAELKVFLLIVIYG